MEETKITKEQKLERLEKSLNNVNEGISRLKNKEGKIIFFVSDTQGNARGSIINIYHQAETLINLGYNVNMLYEKNDYKKPSTWGKSEYDDIPTTTIQDSEFKVSSSDILVVPEIHADVLQKTENLPLHRVILIQSHEYMLDNFQIGKTWTDYGVFDVLTNSETIVDMIKDIGHSDRVSVIKPYINDEFKVGDTGVLKKPVVVLYSKEQRKSVKLIKQFTTKYPMYRWVNFTDAHGTHHESLPKLLSESMLTVWNDRISTLGRFALESLHCNTPVVGVLPDIPQEWMTGENGIWVSNDNDMIDVIATYVKQWIEDNLDVLGNVNETVKNVGLYEEHKESVETAFSGIINRRIEFLENIAKEYSESMEKIEAEEENEVEIIENKD